MNVFEGITTGLNEAVDYEKGSGSARTVRLAVAPVPDLPPRRSRLCGKP